MSELRSPCVQPNVKSPTRWMLPIRSTPTMMASNSRPHSTSIVPSPIFTAVAASDRSETHLAHAATRLLMEQNSAARA